MTRGLITTPIPFRSIVRVTQPEVEPVSLFEVKQHLGIMPEVADDDDFLMGLIASARIVVEERLYQTTMATQWRAKAFRWSSCSCRGIELPYPPVLWDDGEHAIQVRWTDADGNWQVADPANVVVDYEEIPGRLHIKQSIYDACCESTATVTWWAGYRRPQDVPAPIRTAIKRIVGACYSARGDTPEGILRRDPAVDSLLASCSISGRY